MATPGQWIESAALTPKPPFASDMEIGSRTVLALPTGDPEAEALERARARRAVRRFATRHDCIPACTVPGHDADPDACPCTFICEHPHHARDEANTRDILTALGLEA
jgi:hypothetical protein